MARPARPRASVLPAAVLLAAALIGCVPGPGAAGADEDPFPLAAPEEVGMSAEGLVALADSVRRWVDTDQIVGAVVKIVRHDRTVLREAFGWADREREIPMGEGFVFQVRSMTKTLTATAILQLAEQGRLSLEDRAADYLPAFEREGYRDIELRHLLTHTSGMQGGVSSGEPSLLQAVETVVRGRDLDFEPGTGWRYTDAGSATLGAIVEVVSGLPLHAYLRLAVFEPLGMADTWCQLTAPDDGRIARLAARYSGGPGNWSAYVEAGELDDWRWCRGTGGTFSTVRDFARFAGAWKAGGALSGARILLPETVRDAVRPHAVYVGGHEEAAEVWGYHWLTYTDEFGQGPKWYSPGTFAHSGSDGTLVVVDPARELVFLYFTQSRGTETRRPAFWQPFLREAVLEPR